MTVFTVNDTQGNVISYLVQLEPYEPREIVASSEEEAKDKYLEMTPLDDPEKPFVEVEVIQGGESVIERIYY